MSTGEIRLRARGLSAGYGQAPVVSDLSIEVRAGEVVLLLGPNGAGKTTTLMALTGALPLMAGGTEVLGVTGRQPLHRHARRGLVFIPESRGIFSGLSVRDNVRLARCDEALLEELAPELARLQGRRAGMLSGGEQQILSLCRGLARRPKLLVADEMSLGLAPLIVSRLLHTVRRAADDGAAVLLVEQHAHQALQIADRGYVLRRGSVVLEGAARDLSNRIDELEATYLSDGSNTQIRRST